MFSRILVPLDGTLYAEEILQPVRRLAAAYGSRVMLMRAVTPIATGDAEADQQLEADELDQADARLHELVVDLRSCGVDADMVVCAGDPFDGILEAAAREDADVIIVRPQRNWQQAAARGTATLLRLLEYAAIPVLVWIGAVNKAVNVLDGTPDGRPFLERNASTILVPLDGSTLAERALPLAEALAHNYGAQLLLVRAVPSAIEPLANSMRVFGPTPLLAEPSADRLTVEYLQRVDQATSYLKRMQHDLDRRDIRAQARVSTGPPLAAIQAALARSRPNLIVMASHGYGSYRIRYLNSIAVRVIEQVEVPVLVIPAGGVVQLPHAPALPSLEPAQGI